MSVALAPRAGWATTVSAVYRLQLNGARSARGPMFFVATLQSVGILLLLRGVVDRHEIVTRESVVAGATVLVVAYVALNLLAQRVGLLRQQRALDYFGALPVRPSAVVLGIAASYTTVAVPGTVVTALCGAALYDLPEHRLWLLVPVDICAGAALAGLGAVIGLAARRAETATVLGQLAMTIVLFLGIIPAARLPVVLRVVRAAVPSTYAVDALAEAFRPNPDWLFVAWHLAVCAVVAVAALALAARLMRRAVSR